MIWLERVSKTFAVRSSSGRSRMMPWFGRQEAFHALSDLTISISRGEVVGLQGANGSGKTTLLRLLAGVFSPSSGQIRVEGTVVPLLALGAGFQDHLSGRENVFLNGALLGVSPKLISQRIDEIREYSGLGEHFDRPLRHYSSGMRSRLGFSVAMHVEADVLLLDEIFAVGDSDFRRQAIASMDTLIGDGRTVVMASHDEALLRRVCGRFVFLEGGRIVEDAGHPEV